MCIDPATMIAGISKAATSIGTAFGGGLGTAATIAAGGVSAYSQMQNAKAQKKAAIATAEAQDVAAREALAAGRQESQQRLIAGSQRRAEAAAQMAANGIDITGGQGLDILDDAALLDEQDAFTIRENARRSARGYAQQAANSRADAKTAGSAAILGPIGTTLTTAAQVGKRYAPYVAADRQAGGAY
jgi:hypothetical protein